MDAELIRSYRLCPVIVQHYSVDAGGGRKGLPARTATHLADAIENAMAVGYDAFAGQVLAYLEPEYQDHYGGRQAWNALQEQVVAGLEALRP